MSIEKITFSASGTPDISKERIAHMAHCAQVLEEGTGKGETMRGWITVPESYDAQEKDRLLQRAAYIRKNSDVLIIIGIGGSYLGARAVIDAVQGGLYNARDDRGGPQVYYAGHHLNAQYLSELRTLIEDKNVHINVISKSGTTLEPAIAFRIFRDMLIAKYGRENLIDHITVTTDRTGGALKKLVDSEEYEAFVVPDDIGGRYSVLTPVGLLPIAVAGVDIDELCGGAIDMMNIRERGYAENPMMQYAATRVALYDADTKIEALVSYDPALAYVSEWWKQLFGESEGKGGKGLFPASLQFTTDLHSMGQYVQEGERHLCETTIVVMDEKNDLAVPTAEANHDGLDALVGTPLSHVQEAARAGVHDAHLSGEVPQMMIAVPDRSARNVGRLLYFFEYACALSAYGIGVNPFDQPGVEAYKKKMNDNLAKIAQK